MCSLWSFPCSLLIFTSAMIQVHPEESDPAGMLCRVLVLLAAIVPMAVLKLAWCLA